VDCVVDCDGVLNLSNRETSGIIMYHRTSHLIGPECRVSTIGSPAVEQDVQQSRRRPLHPSAQCASRSTPFHLVGACMSKLSPTRTKSGSPRGRAERIEVPCRTRLRQVDVSCDSKDVIVQMLLRELYGHASGMHRAQTPCHQPKLGHFFVLLYVQPSGRSSISMPRNSFRR
jgi:hypothetical protein